MWKGKKSNDSNDFIMQQKGTPHSVSDTYQRPKAVSSMWGFCAKMALAPAKSLPILLPSTPPSHSTTRFLKHVFPYGFSNPRISISLSRVFDSGDFTLTRSILHAAVTRIVDNVPAPTLTTTTFTVEIPVTCYQVIIFLGCLWIYYSF